VREESSVCDTVLIVGVGTVGAALFELLCRTALVDGRPGRAFLVDPGYVRPYHLGKSAIYDRSSVGRRKVDAAAAWAARLCPELQVIALSASIGEVGMGPAMAVGRAGFVFCAADTYRAKMVASRQAWRAGASLVIGELSAVAPRLDGRYRYFVPGPQAPCLECNWQRQYAELDETHPCAPAPAARPRGPETRLSAAYRVAAAMLEQAQCLATAGPASPLSEEIRMYPTARRTLTLLPRRNPACCFDHVTWTDVCRPSGSASAAVRLGDLLETRLSLRSRDRVQLELDRPLATGFACASGHEWPGLGRPDSMVGRCPACGEPGTPTNLTRHLTAEEVNANRERALVPDLLPAGDVLRVIRGAEAWRVALPEPPEWRPAPATPAPGARPGGPL